MKILLQNIIPNVQKYINRKLLLKSIEQSSWYDLINILEYSFLEKNRLIIENNGKIIEAKWEILPNDKIVISQDLDAISYSILFFKENWIILVSSQNITDVIILSNKKNLNINSFLDELNSAQTSEGDVFEYISHDGNKCLAAKMFVNATIELGSKLLDGLEVADGKYQSIKNSLQFIQIKNNLVTEFYYKMRYETALGEVVLKQAKNIPFVGDSLAEKRSKIKSVKINENVITFNDDGKIIRVSNIYLKYVIIIISIMFILAISSALGFL